MLRSSTASKGVSIEREIFPASALPIAKAFLKSSGASYRIETFGHSVKTTKCSVSFPGDVRKFVGHGKGVGVQSEASALFEAIEHWKYANDCMNFLTNPTPFDVRGSDSRFASGSPNWLLIFGSETPCLSRLNFCALGSTIGDCLQVPTFLVHPDFDTDCSSEANTLREYNLYRYSTNSGTAAGTTKAEALLHGVLELVERDAIGMALIESVISNEPVPTRKLMENTFPFELKYLMEDIRKEVNGLVECYDITTDLCVPAVLVSIQTAKLKSRRVFGYGCSIDPEYAVERAALEALQGYHIETTSEYYRKRTVHQIGEHPSLFQRCFLEGGVFAYRGGALDRSFQDFQSDASVFAGDSIDQRLSALLSHLDALGIKTYSRVIEDGVISVIQAFSPNLERFHLVSHGNIVAPGHRGRATLTRLHAPR